MNTTNATSDKSASVEAVLTRTGAAELAALVEAAFAKVVGPERSTRLASLNMDFPGSVAPGDPLTATAWIERSTRTLYFVSADVRRASDGCVIAAASGVLCVLSNPVA